MSWWFMIVPLHLCAWVYDTFRFVFTCISNLLDMNLIDLAKNTDKAVLAQHIHAGKGTGTLIQLKKEGVLREHQSATEALLVLLSGKAVYEEADRREILGEKLDFVRIPAKVTHKLSGTEDALLLLIQ